MKAVDLNALLAASVRLAGMQELVGRCTDASARKGFIMAAREYGAISDDDAALLIQAHGLETA